MKDLDIAIKVLNGETTLLEQRIDLGKAVATLEKELAWLAFLQSGRVHHKASKLLTMNRNTFGRRLLEFLKDMKGMR